MALAQARAIDWRMTLAAGIAMDHKLSITNG